MVIEQRPPIFSDNLQDDFEVHASPMNAALCQAVKRGDPIEIRRLLSEGHDPNESFEGVTPMSIAAARGNTLVLQLLLDGGAKPDGYALRVAALGNHRQAVRLLLAAGAPVGAENGHTPLLNELRWSQFSREQLGEVRRLLREAGARELPEWYLRWRWSLLYGWRWRLRRLLASLGLRQTR